MSGSNNTLPPFVSEISDEELSLIANAKRFVERYVADGKFREKLLVSPQDTVKEYDINIDPEDIRTMWDAHAAKKSRDLGLPPSHIVELCVRYDEALTAWMKRRKTADSITDPNLSDWWQRQLARNDSEIGRPFNAKDLHAPVCFELTKGCTVGCWFCAISAEKFAGYFEYTPENAKLWKDVLAVVGDIIGPAADVGFCYWATDPYDNPDYEEFIKDYHAILGALPPTTTASPHKDIERTRALLQMWKEHSFVYNRMSILSTRILDKIHSEFSAEELVWTGLELLTKDSTVKKANAGRALEKKNRLAEKGRDSEVNDDGMAPGTIACVTGFLFNMVEKSVKLISPCQASDRWPLGYRIYDQCNFSSGEELRGVMQGMIEKHMPLSYRESDRVGFRLDLQYNVIPDGFELLSKFQRQAIKHPIYGVWLGEIISSNEYTLDMIVEEAREKGIDSVEILTSIDILFKGGFLDDEPSIDRASVVNEVNLT